VYRYSSEAARDAAVAAAAGAEAATAAVGVALFTLFCSKRKHQLMTTRRYRTCNQSDTRE
jgi:hypothetical protein